MLTTHSLPRTHPHFERIHVDRHRRRSACQYSSYSFPTLKAYTENKQWLAELGGVFYSIKEKGYSAREKRVTEHEFNRKMEIETQMAEDKERHQRQVDRVREVEEEGKKNQYSQQKLIKRPATGITTSSSSSSSLALRRVVATSQHGAVKRPLTPRVGRGF